VDEDAKALATQTLMLLHHARSALDRAAEAKGIGEVQEHIKEAQRHLTVLLEVAQKATIEATVQAREGR
jgi:hypothetical protein